MSFTSGNGKNESRKKIFFMARLGFSTITLTTISMVLMFQNRKVPSVCGSREALGQFDFFTFQLTMRQILSFVRIQQFFRKQQCFFNVSDISVKAETKLTRHQQIATDLISMEHDLLAMDGDSRLILFMERLPFRVRLI